MATESSDSVETSQPRPSREGLGIFDPGILGAVLAGLVLRWLGLSHQLLVDDELHVLRAVLEMPISQILVTYRETDFCQPLAAFYRLLIDRGVLLTEAHFRLPILISSVATIGVLPAMVYRRTGHRAAVLFAWLIALSPMLVLYGRMVRSYGLVLLLSSAAVFAFYEWWLRPRVIPAMAYIVLAGGAVFAHLGAATFVLSPFLFAVVDVLWRSELRRRARRTLILASLTAACMLTFLLPAWPTLGPVIESARISQGFRWEIVGPVLSMQAGSSLLPAVLGFWFFAALGLATIMVRRGRFALYTIVLIVGHLTGLLLLSPWGLASPQIFNRYILVLLPIVILWTAVGLAVSADWLRSRFSASKTGQAVFTCCLVFLWFCSGPLVRERFRVSSFVHSHDLLSIFTEPAQLPEDFRPRFYRDLGSSVLPAGPVAEFPQRTVSLVSRASYIHQETHRQRVLASTLSPRLRDPRLALRGHVTPTGESFLTSDARYLVIHRDPEAEETAIVETHWMRVFPMPEEFWQVHRDAATRLAESLTRDWGPADYSEPVLQAWDLERVRRDLSETPSEQPSP